jgi:hypothetical protein
MDPRAFPGEDHWISCKEDKCLYSPKRPLSVGSSLQDNLSAIERVHAFALSTQTVEVHETTEHRGGQHCRP